jgi:DNA topoisomerase VI subunit A
MIEEQPEPEFIDAAVSSAVVKTVGPRACFSAVLFIEKEGFGPLLKAARIAERYDLFMMSSKGMSVVAARKLAEEICGRYGVKLLILHDFDRAGIIIKHTLHNNTRRYTFTRPFEVIDLGLRLADVNEMELQSEEPGGSRVSDRELKNAGATPEEIAFLGEQRVELNAMTSDQFIAFLERKLKEHGITKVVPKSQELNRAYALFAKGEKLQEAFAEVQKSVEVDCFVPEDLAERVTHILAEHPRIPWHQAVHSLLDPSILPDDEDEDGAS